MSIVMGRPGETPTQLDWQLQLHYMGHAGFVATAGDGTAILIDPWFFPAFLESWFPWPDNRHLLSDVWKRPVGFLYVSHIHQDHFDRRVLTGLSKQTVVLCADFRSKSLFRMIRSLGFNELVVLGHGESVQLGPALSVTMLLDTSHKEDSALLVEASGFRFLDLNDCHLRLNEMPRNVDLLAAQFSGAMWYPNCYRYPPAEMDAKVATVRSNITDTLVRTALACDARSYLPSAGPACFLDPLLDGYNDPDSTIFQRWEDVADEFAARCPDTAVITALPGARILCRPSGVTTEDLALGITADDLGTYRERRRDEWHVHEGLPTHVTTGELTEYFSSLLRKNRQLAVDLVKRIRLVSEGDIWDIGLGPYPRLQVVEGPGDSPCDYTFEVPGWILRLIVDRKTTWEDALLSMRLRLARQPDVFDMALLGLLRYGNQPIQTQQMVVDGRRTEELIERDGWRLQRFCPHAGEDLTLATISGSVIECPRHHWKWNLLTGDCLEGGTIPLVVKQTPATTDAGVPAS